MKKISHRKPSRSTSTPVAATELALVQGGTRYSTTDEPWGELKPLGGPYPSTGDGWSGGSDSTAP